MSVSSVNSGAAYAYLQSLLQQQSSANSSGTGDPVASLLQAFYPNGMDSTPNSPATPAGLTSSSSAASCGPPTQFAPATLGAMISLQSQQSGTDPLADRVQSIFTQFDTDGNGSISKSEFENAFGPNADMSKVDTLFSALDTNGDGSIDLSELTSDARQSKAMHHHRHHSHGAGNAGPAGGADPLAELISATQGASSSTVNNPDGSTTTTVTYADGSTVSMNMPAASSSGQSADGGSGSQNPAFNFLEQLIQLQSQFLAQSASALTSTLPIV